MRHLAICSPINRLKDPRDRRLLIIFPFFSFSPHMASLSSTPKSSYKTFTASASLSLDGLGGSVVVGLLMVEWGVSWFDVCRSIDQPIDRAAAQPIATHHATTKQTTATASGRS